MVTLKDVEGKLAMTIWGKHSLTIGELLGLAVGVAIILFNWLGKWSLWVGIAVIAVCMMLF